MLGLAGNLTGKVSKAGQPGKELEAKDEEMKLQ